MAVQFTGTERLSIADASAALIDINGTNPMSIGMWIWIDAVTAAYQYVAGKWNDTGSLYQYLLGVESTGAGSQAFFAQHSGAAANFAVTPGAPTLGAWAYMLGRHTWNSRINLRFGSTNYAPVYSALTTANTAAAFTIGAGGDGGAAFAGRAADVAIWASDLSDGNVALLAAGARPNEIGVAPVAWWPLKSDYGDDSGNNYTLTATGSPSFVSDPPLIAEVALATGDLTTAFDTYYDSDIRAKGDANTKLRSELASQYGVAGTSDLTTLMARFLKRGS